jgi:type VI secretion system secreted protein Hcp
MPNPFYVAITGATQGEITGAGSWPGEDVIKGHEKETLVYQFSHEVLSPRDTATGQATGKRQHKPIRFVKRKDKASPQLYQALVNNENLTKVVFKWFRPKVRAQGEEHYYTVELLNASVCELQDVLPDTLDPQYANATPRETVGLTYQTITWTWVLTGVTATDDWLSPVR